MRRWPWGKIVIRVAFGLVLVGVAPLVSLFWWQNTHNIEPVSEPIELRRGEYTTSVFTADINDVYQIDIYFLPYDRTPLDVDWRVVDTSDALVASGAYRDVHHGGNGATIGRYRPKRGSRQRVVVRILEDVQGADTQPRLHVGVPEMGLDLMEGFLPVALLFGAVVSGTGGVALLVLMVVRIFRGGWRGIVGWSGPSPSGSEDSLMR